MVSPTETALILAPGAGSGIGAKLAERLLARSDFLPLLEDAAVAALQANMPPRWDPSAKDWAPDLPDAKTRLAALLGLMAQLEGDPVKRIIHQHLGQGGGLDLQSVLKESPELAALMARELEKANWHKSGRNGKAKKAEPVAATEEP